MALQNGVATRPPGSDNYWPPVGTRVPWVVTQPVQDMLDQGQALGWENLGTIGNTFHLQRHGDHTPWSAGKQRGRLYAKDTHVPDWFAGEMLALMRDPDYDTRWVDFVNIAGSQYDGAGNWLDVSGDSHLHVSVNAGFENAHVTFFADIDKRHRGEDDVAITDEDIKRFWAYQPFDTWLTAGAAVGQTYNYLTATGPVQTKLNTCLALLNQILADTDSIDSMDDKVKEQVDAAVAGIVSVQEMLEPPVSPPA